MFIIYSWLAKQAQKIQTGAKLVSIKTLTG